MTMTNKDDIESKKDGEETTDTEGQDLEKILEEEGDIEADDEDDVETLKKKLATSEAQKKHWRGKAENGKPAAKAADSKPDSGLSQMDLLALARSNVHDDDIADIVDYAKFKNISVAEAMKSSTVKAVIAEKTEFRKTAEITNTGNAKRTTSKVSDQALLENASKGIFPEKGSEEADRLFWARRGGKRS